MEQQSASTSQRHEAQQRQAEYKAAAAARASVVGLYDKWTQDNFAVIDSLFAKFVDDVEKSDLPKLRIPDIDDGQLPFEFARLLFDNWYLGGQIVEDEDYDEEDDYDEAADEAGEECGGVVLGDDVVGDEDCDEEEESDEGIPAGALVSDDESVINDESESDDGHYRDDEEAIQEGAEEEEGDDLEDDLEEGEVVNYTA